MRKTTHVLSLDVFKLFGILKHKHIAVLISTNERKNGL